MVNAGMPGPVPKALDVVAPAAPRSLRISLTVTLLLGAAELEIGVDSSSSAALTTEAKRGAAISNKQVKTSRIQLVIMGLLFHDF
jgi:hypothetical protein